METLDVTCPQCGEIYHVSPEHAGRSLRCRRCGHVFEIRTPQTTGAPRASSPAAGSGQGAAVRTAPHPATATVPSAASTTATATATATAPIEVTDRDFAQVVLQSPRPALVDFWAAWCGPCRALAPTVEQLAQEYAGRVTFAKLNADDNPRTAAQYGVMGLPTLVLFKGGREVGRLVGLQPKANIKRAIDQVA